jgi:thiamine pyrophosphate-dependent acetolactate synthase large subunit-like protein
MNRRAGWAPDFADVTVPVFTTLAAKGLVDECGIWSAGVFTGDGGKCTPESRVIPHADLIVGLGLRTHEILTPRCFPVPAVFLDIVESRDVAGFSPDHVLASAKPDHFKSVLTLLSQKRWGADCVHEACALTRARLVGDQWLPGQLFDLLEQHFQENVALVLDTGLFCTVAEHVWRARLGREFIASANGRFMGVALPLALGVALGRKKLPTVCVVGDGGIRTYIAEIKLLVELGLPMLIILASDGAYGSIAGAAAERLSQNATRIPRPSWFRAIEELGCASWQVSSRERFLEVLSSWSGNGPAFIEAVFDARAYREMTTGVR